MATDVPKYNDISDNVSSNYNVLKKGSLFAEINKQLGLLPGFQGLSQDLNKLDQQTQTPGSTTPLENVRHLAEVIAADVIKVYVEDSDKKPPNRYCKTMRRTVKELSDRHDIAFKGMVNKLNVNDTTAFPTFVSVVDEIFEDGQINWGRIVAVYTFAVRLAKHCKNESPDCDERIALYAGKYVASKLGKWILDNGGWEAFADYFPEQGAMEDKLWKGLVFTAVGLGALATMVAAR